MRKILCLLLVSMLLCSAMAETVQDQALAFIQAAGIAADGVNRIGDEVVVNLPGGGSAVLTSAGDFDMFDLRWRFVGATDEEIALYLDHALSLLAALEAKIPADTENLSVAEALRARNYAMVVSNGLHCLENVGPQGLNVLLWQMETQPDSSLNSLRKRLAEQIEKAMTPEAAGE